MYLNQVSEKEGIPARALRKAAHDLGFKTPRGQGAVDFNVKDTAKIVKAAKATKAASLARARAKDD
jgi:hypothetical protein